MKTETLAEYLERHIHIAAMHDECASMLRKQHEAIKVLREALEMIAKEPLHCEFVEAVALDALKDTEEIAK